MHLIQVIQKVLGNSPRGQMCNREVTPISAQLDRDLCDIDLLIRKAYPSGYLFNRKM